MNPIQTSDLGVATKRPWDAPDDRRTHRFANFGANRKPEAFYNRMIMNPIVGITAQQSLVKSPGGQLPAHVVNKVYTDAVIRTGGGRRFCYAQSPSSGNQHS